MNPTEADLLPLPPELREFRDQLRVVGYELVRFTRAFAHAAANSVRHPVADYEFAIHRIESIDEQGQLHVNPNPFFSSAARVPDWTRYYVETERPAGIGIFKAFFREPARAIVTLVVPPYGLALLGLAALGDRADARQQRERRQQLPKLSELPKFLHPYSRNEA